MLLFGDQSHAAGIWLRELPVFIVIAMLWRLAVHVLELTRGGPLD